MQFYVYIWFSACADTAIEFLVSPGLVMDTRKKKSSILLLKSCPAFLVNILLLGSITFETLKTIGSFDLVDFKLDCQETHKWLIILY